MENKDTEIVKENLKELFQFGIYKLENNLCTPEEIRSVERMIESNLELDGTITDIATFFDKPEVNVRVVINQKLIAKPKRKVLYPFVKFLKVAPRKWFEKDNHKM